MKNSILLLLLLFWVSCFSQAIKVDTGIYTIPQLVTDVLVNRTCVPVSNITWRTGTNFGSTNGIGHFDNVNPLFPFTSGVILSTGNVENSVGPNTTDLNEGSSDWIGDTDLEATLLAAGINMKSTNATVLEFDFVPSSSNFDFNFVFASEEYGNFQCQFSDAFAFLLTNTTTGVTTNLAVIPNSSIPISVVTIRDALYNSSCSSENLEFFGAFNGGSNAETSATNFNGQSVTMSASSNSLIPNTTYHIKLVIADRDDSKSDSAIFLGANSFNVGQNVLGPDLTILDNTAICDQGSHTLVSGLNPAIYSFAWTFNGSSIGGNTPDLVVTEPGIYGLTYTITATSCIVTTDFITIEYFEPITTAEPFDLYRCNSGSASYTYDLSFNDSIVNIPDPKISYHSSANEAILGTNPLPINYNVNKANLPIKIWIRIEDLTSKCVVTKTIQLGLTAAPIAYKSFDIILCENIKGANSADFTSDLQTQTASILKGQSPLIYNVSYYSTINDANSRANPIDLSVPFTSGNTTIFARVETTTEPTCYRTTDFKLVVLPAPTIDQIQNQYVCISYTLPQLINPGNYYSGPNQGLPMLNAGDVIIKDQTIYIFNATSGTPSCSSENSFRVKIVKPADLNPIDVESCDEYILPSTTYGRRYFSLPGGPSGGGIEFPAGSKIISPGTTTVYTYFETVTKDCVLKGKFDVTIYETPIVLPIANVFECLSYTLPTLAVGDYYTLDELNNKFIPAVSPITVTTTLYVFAVNGTCRSFPIRIFTVYIKSLGFSDIKECLSYDLLPSPVGEFRDAPNGGGNLIPPGLITKTTKIYTYISGAACPTDVFTITIDGPFLTTPTDEIACNSFLLPPQQEGGKYYTLPGGTTTSENIELLPNVDRIIASTTVYIFKPSATEIGCFNEKPWLITIIQKPKIASRSNVEQCDSYVLSPLENGAYYDDSNGINPLAAGTSISKNNRIYIYAVNPDFPRCVNENFFDITINGVGADAVPKQLSYCDSFTFPPLPTPKNFYYDAPGGPLGSGKIIPVGTTVTAATVLPNYYIYVETSNRLNCSDDLPFSISITPRPIANTVSPIIACDDFGPNDGVFQFDLNSLAIRNEVLLGQIPDTNFTLTFFSSLADANDPNAVPIANPSSYQNDNPYSDSVWIKVSNNTSTVACFDVVELKLIVYPIPTIQLLPEYFICEDYLTGTLLNPATLNSGIPSKNYLFDWTKDGVSYGGNTPSITTSEVGNYVLTATNTVTLCSKTAQTKVIKYNPYAEVTYSDAFVYPTFITINILGSGSGNYEYQLDDFPFQDSFQFNNVGPGEHIINVRDKDGHCNPPPLNAIIINYPKFFTPNGDGYNEQWNIPHLLSTNPNAPIFIFDRYGKFLKEISPSTAGWNGLFNGQPLPSSDYWFTVDYNEKGTSKVFKSHFSLKR
ncbi:choice-of-anchor L domain-containing protein [Flavobacterium sp.]|uniref:T9SS type B sorting domain-containing protein n=1 Tax=Flavobacterium sp. TaxID=239 RepID=UPI00286E9701|nr:choice-of-anchor L domain-containing protein [Flavobacterium sp.]